MNTNIIYLDYSASTPVHPQVLDKMLPFFREHFANPSSQHRAGWLAQQAVEKARSQVSQLLNTRLTKEIVFTSGASEANTLALLGCIQTLRQQNPNRRLHAITSAVEHKSVLETFHQIAELGVDVDYLPTNEFGQVEVSTLEKALRPETALMSFMWANNEVGSLNPMAEISALATKHNIYLHSDATQACGKLPIDLQSLPIDMLSLSAHKMYGPKGVGALYVRHVKHHPFLPLWPIVRGGGQEFNLRAGTSNVPAIVGLGVAADLAAQSMEAETSQLHSLVNFFMERLKTAYPGLRLNGHPTERLPGHLHLTFPEVRWDQWLPRMSHLCVSTTSACSSEAGQGSHVLQAMGFTSQQMQSSLRISLGKMTTESELEAALELFQKVFNQG